MMIAKRGQGLSPVVAGIMDRGQLGVFGLVNLDPPRLDVFLQKLKYAQNPKLVVGRWKPCLEPEPGCKVGVASFRIEDCLHL